MVMAKVESGQTRATPGESGEAPVDANVAAPFKNDTSPAHEPPHAPPPIPWHILFPPGHPMHGAGHA